MLTKQNKSANLAARHVTLAKTDEHLAKTEKWTHWFSLLVQLIKVFKYIFPAQSHPAT